MAHGTPALPISGFGFRRFGLLSSFVIALACGTASGPSRVQCLSTLLRTTSPRSGARVCNPHSDFIMSLADLRKDYTLAGLRRVELDADPIQQFRKWFQQALDAQLLEPTAMTLATADQKGRPSARIVLLKGLDGRGFIFFTNYESRKGRDLAENPKT